MKPGIFILTLIIFGCKANNNEKQNGVIETSETHFSESPNPKSESVVIDEVLPIVRKNLCSYENETSSLGLGLLIPDGNNTGRLEIFENEDQSELFAEINIDSYELPEVCAKYNKPDYGILHFVCLDSTDRYFKILVNYDEVKYVSTTESGYKFITWNQYIRTAYSARRKKQYQTNYIFEIPNDSSDTIGIPEEKFESFCVLDI